ncbi:MAG: sensor histidine kinase [Candidatus Xenobiia bacterium LiM19]
MTEAKPSRKFWWTLSLSFFFFTLGSLFLAGLYLLLTLAPQMIRMRDDMLMKRMESLIALLAPVLQRSDRAIELPRLLEVYNGPLDPAIWILDEKGEIVMMSPNTSSLPQPDREVVRKVMEGRTLSGALPARRTFYRAIPIKNNEKTVGAVYLLFSTFIPPQYRLAPLIPALKAFALIALLSLVVSTIMARRLTRPLEEMTETARRLGAGDLSARVKPVKVTQEMEVLSTALNTMAGRLSLSVKTLEEEKKQLETMEKTRRDLIASLSHEIRTPLSIIQGCSEALQDGVVSGEDASRYLDVIHTEVKRLDRLFGDLIQLSTLEAGILVLTKEVFSLRRLFEEAEISLELELSRKGFTTSCEGDDDMLFADKERFRQIILNLLENSLRYCPDAAAILFRFRREGNSVVITFEDNGPGVPEEELSQIFQHFYRVDKSRSKQKGGSGLGLAIIEKLVVLHGGTVKAANVESGGLRFTISLPGDSLPVFTEQ